MLGAAAVPGLLLCVVALVAPESPRWLMMVGRKTEAASERRKIRPEVNVQSRLDPIAAGFVTQASQTVTT